MLGAKRKLASSSLPLNRRVRPRLEEDEDINLITPNSDSDDGGSANAGSDPDDPDDEDDAGEEEDVDGDEEASDESVSALEEQGAFDASSVTFGALVRAQASLSKSSSRKRPAEEEEDDAKPSVSISKLKSAKKDAKPRLTRRNKNAPMEQSSKRPVRRLYAFTHSFSAPSAPPSSTKKRVSRDPRFDPLIVSETKPKGAAAAAAAEKRARQAYAFLQDYRLSELRGLRAELRDKKVPQARKDEVRQEIASIESRQKAKDRKELEKKVQEEHRAKERDMAGKGKKPYFLKKAEVKKRVLVEKFAGMTEKQAEKVIERRRKKVTSRERRELDHLQRAR